MNKKRTSGILMHISSLWGDYSIGSFGEAAKKFIDIISEQGFSWWQVLPFCMADECNSPYKSYSAFGGNPYFVDLEKLNKKGLITNDELIKAKQNTPYSCEYERLRGERFELLMKASKRVRNRNEIEDFIQNHKYIAQFSEFMALKAVNGEKSWDKWETDVIDEDVLFMWKFIQFEFFMQWAEIRIYANSKGIGIIGDIPIYVSYDSADVWANRELFRLKEDGTPAVVAGVPPDYFCADGQLWGNPIYDWDKMKKDGYSWWIDRLRHMFSMFDGVRIDHFRGLESYWAVPHGAKTAKTGIWEKGPGKDFIDKINEIKGDKLIIAEDLGDITPEVCELVEYSGFPGMRVMQFGFMDHSDSTHKPHNYIKNVIAYTGTHDNNTLLGFVWEQGEDLRRELLEYCGYTDENWDRGYDNIIRTLMASCADTVIMPVQDILGYGADTRLNTPGTAEGNWAFRITEEQLRNADLKKFKRFNEIYKR